MTETRRSRRLRRGSGTLGLVDGQALDETRLAALFTDRGLYRVAALPRLQW